MPTRISDFLNTTFSTLTLNDAVNTGVVYPGTIVHTTTGVPGTGIGAGIRFQVETSNNNNEYGMTLETVTTDVTASSEDFDFIIKLMQNGSAVAERLRLSSGGQLTVSSGVTAFGTFAGVGTDTTQSFNAAPTSIAATSYNYVLSGTNDTGNKLVIFVNGSQRSADGGTNGTTIRNDGGNLNVGGFSYFTNVYASTATIDATTQINLAATTFITGGTGGITLADSGDITCYRSGGTTGVIYLTSGGTRYLFYDGTLYQLNGAGLNVGGAITATGEITAFSSDMRLKGNVRLIDDPIGRVMAINGVTFDWDLSKSETIGFTPKHTHDVGVIAQEIEKVLPQAVRSAPFDTDSNGESKSGEQYLTVQYEKLTALLIEAVKDQQKQISKLEQRIDNLEKKLA